MNDAPHAPAPLPSRATEEWNDHWDAFANASSRNPAQSYRRKLVFEHLGLDRAAAPVRLLDLGSGTGAMASDVLRVRPDADVLGLDASASGVALASRTVPRARFVQQDFTHAIDPARLERDWATHAVCSEVLEHLDNPSQVLRHVRPLMKRDCRFVVTVPAGPMSAFDKHIGHRRHFTPGLLRKTLEDGGFEVRDLRGAGFPFFNVYRLAVVARGQKLVDDVTVAEGGRLSKTAGAVMDVFSWLFKLNSGRTTWGWQLVAVASPVA